MARPQRTYVIDPNKRKLFLSLEEEQEYIEESSTSHEDECDKEEYEVDEDANDDDDDDDSERSDDINNDDDDDDDFVAPANQSRSRNGRVSSRTGQQTRSAAAAATNQSSRRPTRTRRGKEQEEGDLDQSEEEDVVISKLKPQTRQNGPNDHPKRSLTRNRTALAGDEASEEQHAKRASAALKDDDDEASFLDEDDDGDEEEMPNPSPKKRGRPKKTVASFNDDDDEASFPAENDDNNDDDEEEMTKPSPRKRGRPKKTGAALEDDDDGEEEFSAHEEDDDDDDDDDDNDDDDDFEEIINSTQRKRGRPRKIQAPQQNSRDKNADKTTARKRGRARKLNREDDDDDDDNDNDDEESYHDEKSDEEDEDDDDDDEEEEVAVKVAPKKRGRPKKASVQPKNTPRKRGRPRKNPLPPDDNSEETDISKPMAQRSNRQERPGRPRMRIAEEEDDSDDVDDDSSVQWNPGQARQNGIHSSKRARRSTRLTYNEGELSVKGKNKNTDDDDGNIDSDDQGDAPLSVRRTTPERFSVAYAKQNISYAENSDDDVDDENDKIPYSLPTTKSRLRGSSDEEFLADDEEVMGIIETDSDDVVGDDDDDSLLEDVKAMTADQENDDDDDEKKVAAKNIDDEKLGSEEDSGDEENEAKTHKKNGAPNPSTPENTQAKSSRHLSEITPRSKSQHSSDDSSSEYSGGSDDDKVATSRARCHQCVHHPSPRSRHRRGGHSSAPKLPQCTSTDDAITSEALPQRHVCYFSPDGQSRQCFALETLRHIALANAHQQFRTDLSGEQQQSFLQPPHFRTRMSAFLLDQIASRFGREALDLHGEYYRRKKETDQLPPPRTDSDDQDDDDDPYDYTTRFSHDFQLYIDQQMGSQDVYVCPLCYSEIHTRLDSNGEENQSDSNSEGEDDDRDWSTAQKCLVESKYDPMLVLGYLDNDKFEAASAFCFTKVANLKTHLREDHNVQTKDIQGNDLYMRYKIRAPDGLLQRFINKGSGFGMTYQGAMRIYWNQGNNYSFVCLLSMMEKADWYRNLLSTSEDEEDIDEASAHFEVAKKFIDDFRRRAPLAWTRLSSPFRKSSGQDLKDFLINDDAVEEVEEDDIATRRKVEQLLDAQAASSEDENDLIHKIQRKYAENHDGDGDDDGDDNDDVECYSANDDEPEIDESSASEDPVPVEMPNGYYSEVSEEDDWVKDIQSKKKRRISTSDDLNTKMPASKVSPEETPSAKKKVLRKLKAGSAVKSTKRRALTLDDSDN